MLTLFVGLDHEDPNTHLTKFYKFVGTLGVSNVAFLQLFPHSVVGNVKEWHLDQTTLTMKNWNSLEEKFKQTLSS